MVARWFSSRQHALGEFVSSITVGFDETGTFVCTPPGTMLNTAQGDILGDKLGTQDGITLGSPLGDDELGF